MTKKEKTMLLEIHSLTNAIPNFRNNMDLESYSSLRNDTLEMQSYLHKLTYAMLMYDDPNEDKKHWDKEFDKWLINAKEFISIRLREQWVPSKQYEYQFVVGGW